MKKQDQDKDFDGYNWCLTNWGTKWGICNPRILKETSRRLFYIFETAWSPANVIVIAMSKKFPSLKFTYKYYEGGMGFSGKFIVKDGEVVLDDYSNKYRGCKGG